MTGHQRPQRSNKPLSLCHTRCPARASPRFRSAPRLPSTVRVQCTVVVSAVADCRSIFLLASGSLLVARNSASACVPAHCSPPGIAEAPRFLASSTAAWRVIILSASGCRAAQSSAPAFKCFCRSRFRLAPPAARRSSPASSLHAWLFPVRSQLRVQPVRGWGASRIALRSLLTRLRLLPSCVCLCVRLAALLLFLPAAYLSFLECVLASSLETLSLSCSAAAGENWSREKRCADCIGLIP